MKNNIRTNAIKYSNLNGIPGHEYKIAEALKKEFSEYKFEFERDGLGSIAIIKKSSNENALTVSISTHMDEVGFVISEIDENGFIRFTPMGGWWGHVLLGQRLTITTRTGEEIVGTVGCKPPHIIGPEMRGKVVNIKDMYLDIGAESRKDIEKWGINFGDMITPYQDSAFITKNENRIIGKAYDDRISLVAGIEIMKELSDEELDVNVILVGTTQEEVGLRGAKTSAYKWTPDLSFTIDVTLDYSAPNMPKREPKLGMGPALSLFDRSVIANTKLFDSLREFAKGNEINYTIDSMPNGGTDAGSIHLTKEGVMAMTVSIPCRYFHTHNSVIDVRDAEHTVKLISKYIKKLDSQKINSLKFK